MEVLVAISLLAFSLIYLSRAFLNCLNTMSQAADYTTASLLAEEKFFELQMTKNEMTDGAEDDSFTGNDGFSYHTEINKENNLSLYSARIQAAWKEGKRSGNFEIVSYIPADK